jgi:hypothetical protein
MPVYDSATQDKIVLLRGLRALGTTLEVLELLQVDWPDGTVYYAPTQVDEVASVAPPVSPVEVRIIPDNEPNWFMPVQLEATIGDEEVDVEFWDEDGVFSDLLVEHGEGVKCVVHYWFPQVELMLPIWHGHMRVEDEADGFSVKVKIVQGFRSSEGDVPHRAHYAECQAVFGGVLDTQAEINEYGCPYNLHIGGGIGNNDPDTGLPWTFCTRLSPSNCTERGVNPLFHMSHQTVIAITANNQTHGPRLYSTSAGNENNLKEPVRVVMGTRRIRDMKVMAFARDLNNNTPTHGWFRALYEGPEGSIVGFSQSVFTVGGTEQSAIALHYGDRHGNFGDPPVDPGLTPHGYSGTSHIRYNFGWVDPREVGPSDASASSIVTGLADIRVYASSAAGTGLLGEYFSDTAWTDKVGERIDAGVNFPLNQNSPFIGIPSSGFSARWSGRIRPRYSETYTFTARHDDAFRLNINGTDVIDETLYGTDSGTIALVADTDYDIIVELSQLDAPGYNPWEAVLSWESASQDLEIVPRSCLFQDGAEGDDSFVQMYTSNRVWQLARILCDKRWGFGYDYDRLDAQSFIEAAAWAEQPVSFTDAFGTVWSHVRSDSHVELIAKKVQQQVEDLCTAGRISKPFLFNGKIHVAPLRALTDDELDACPVFTDEGTSRNIAWEEQNDVDRSTLRWSRVSDLELANRIEATFDDQAADYQERPVSPVEDVVQQLRAGRVVGDKARKTNVKKHSYLGVVNKPQAIKTSWAMLDLGPLDEGGLQNNLKLTFKIWFADAIDLHPEKVIKVESSKLTKYGFTYFRVKKIKRLDNLHYELTVQAYNETYMATFETDIAPIQPPIDPPIDPPPCILSFGTITYENGALRIPIDPC